MRFVPMYVLLTGLMIAASGGCSSHQAGSVRNNSYKPNINPADFSAKVDNPYLPLVPGTVMNYVETTPEGKQDNVITITNDTKTIMGVPCRVVHDVVLKDGKVIEDTWDWYSQHKDGTVWYFGEDTTEISKGGLKSKEGSWEAGVDGAQPGIMMPSPQKPGAGVRSEYYKNHAEDMLQIIAVHESATVPAGTFQDCVKTKEWSLLEPGHENKWYARGVGIVRETSTAGDELVLISITTPRGDKSSRGDAKADGAEVNANKSGSPGMAVPPGAKRDEDGSYRLTLDMLPAPVRKTFQDQAGGHKIQGISLELQDAKPVYDCDVFIGGKKHELMSDADGKLLNAPIGSAQGTSGTATPDDLPDTVAKAFKAAFPNGKMTKLDKDQENGVWVHDIEFTNGSVEQECDISTDGTMLEVTLVVAPKDVPEAAMQAIKKGASGGKISRIEKIVISYETKDGKVIKLSTPETHFAAEYAKGDATAEVVVNPDGTPAKG